MGLTARSRFSFSSGGAFALRFVVFTGVLVLLNMIALHLQFDWDTSEGRRHSLAASTLQIVQAVDTPITIFVFVERSSDAIDTLLRKLKAVNRHITTRVVYLTSEAPLAERYNVTRAGTAVVELGERRRYVRAGEQQLAGAVLQLTKGEGKTVVFSSGHGERDLTGQDEDGLGKANSLLRQAGYETVQAPADDDALKDASVLVIASPVEEFEAAEAERVADFVRRGGGLLVLLDPPPRSGLGNTLSHFDIEGRDDYVIELNKSFRHKGYGANTVLVRSYLTGHPVSERMSQAVLLHRVRSLRLNRKLRGEDGSIELFPLCVSSTNSWGEKELAEKEVKWDRGVDEPGPRVLVAASPEPPSYVGAGRLMVVGTSNLATNRFFGNSGNREFFEAAVSWLAGDLDYPLVAQKEPTKKLSLSESQLRLILLICVLALPGISGIVGIAVFVRRTRRSN